MHSTTSILTTFKEILEQFAFILVPKESTLKVDGTGL